MASDLYVNGVLVDRPAARVILHQLQLSLDSNETLEFSQLVEPAGTGDFSEGDAVALDVDGTPAFLGVIGRAVPINIGSGSIAVGFLALGLRYLANLIFVTSSDGTGAMQFNLSPTDPGYLSTNAGLDVGHILTQVLDQHAAQLAAIGITSYDPTDLAALTVVPPEAVTIAGRLWDAMADLLQQWMPNYAIWADAAGAIHVKDTAALPSFTLTLDDDPIILDSITKDHSECFTRVVVRGRADVEGAYLSLKEGTLKAGWTHDEQLAWKLSDFFNPQGAASAGKVLSQTSDTLTIQSDDPTESWAVNHWNDIGAVAWAFNPIATGITFSEQRSITATTALSAGGTATITVGQPFNNFGYTRYAIRGTRTEQSLVWRKLDVVPDFVAFHVARQFNHSVPWSPVDGQVVQTLTPQAVVCWSSSGDPPYNEFPWPIELVLSDGTNPGYIICYQPLCMAYSSQATLQAGGLAVAPPGDFKCLIPYSRGPLEAIAPPDTDSGDPTYEGTAYTVDGIERTLYRDYDSWLDKGAESLMTELARKILDSRKDTVYEGSLSYLDKYTPALTMGQSLNIARWEGITGWEDINAAIRSVSLTWPQSGAAIWETKLGFTTRRRPFTGDRLYVHPGYGAQASMQSAWNPFGLTTRGMMAITQARQAQFEQDYLTPGGQQDDLGITFEGPEKQGLSTAGYNKLIRQLEGEDTRTAKEKQHQRRLDRREEARTSKILDRMERDESKPLESRIKEDEKAQAARDYNDSVFKRKQEEREERETLGGGQFGET